MSKSIASFKEALLQAARTSIAYGLKFEQPITIDINNYPQALREITATFVTLTLNGHLRGCIGKLEAVNPLIIDISQNAYAAAFQDPRFSPLSKTEYPSIHVEISILSKPERLVIANENELVKLLRPDIDGLIIEKGSRRGTFLPSVWQQLSQPSEFIRQLKRKAGINENDTSGDIRYLRYTTMHIDE